MATAPQTTAAPTRKPTIEDSFVADRAVFWNRFTGFTKGALYTVVVVLILMWLFLA